MTKNPTDETVVVGGSCSFTADYQNAVYATWHFVSPDGQKDFDYGGIGVEFPTMTVLNGMYSNLQLSNVPQGMNGWKVYCRYSNDVGSVDTQKATVTVTAAGQGSAAARPGASASTAAAYGGFTGLFVDEDNERTMEISGDSSWYDVKVTWPISSSEIYTWEFGGTFNNEGGTPMMNRITKTLRSGPTAAGISISPPRRTACTGPSMTIPISLSTISSSGEPEDSKLLIRHRTNQEFFCAQESLRSPSWTQPSRRQSALMAGARTAGRMKQIKMRPIQSKAVGTIGTAPLLTAISLGASQPVQTPI